MPRRIVVLMGIVVLFALVAATAVAFLHPTPAMAFTCCEYFQCPGHCFECAPGYAMNSSCQCVSNDQCFDEPPPVLCGCIY